MKRKARTTGGDRRAPVLLVWAVVVAWSGAMLTGRPALADVTSTFVPPPIDGHVTDPGHKLTPADKRDLEDVFDHIQSDTRVDVAAFIANGEPADLDAAGRSAYDQWGIGRGWANGVLLAVFEGGDARVVLAVGHPALEPTFAAKVEADLSRIAKAGQIGFALKAAAGALGTTLRARARDQVIRPAGVHDWVGSGWYGAWAFVILAAASVASIRRRAWRPSPP